jgi:glycosyltransferase involved in cell wall biosynthesis
MKRLVVQHPQHHFHFLFDRPYAPEFVCNPNIYPVVLKPAARHPLLWRWWFDVSVPLHLKKIKADVFVSADGFCSLATRVPQLMVVHDLGFLHYPEWYKKGHAFFYKMYMPRFIKKAKVIATVSHFSKADIENHYSLKGKKIDVLPNAARSIFVPLSLEEKVAVKERHTEGREYFIYTGAIHPRKNLLNLLKAFSLFKKRQRSNWKLVLAGRMAWKNDAFLGLLKTFKYRHDVVLTGYVPEEQLTHLMGAAYALVYPSLFEGFGLPVLEAAQSGVPVLTSANSAMQEIAGEGALYFDPSDPSSMADALMRIYKDEHLRSQLIPKGKERTKNFNWDDTASKMWQCIEEAGRKLKMED